jgi:hypothetical protein
MMENLPPNLPKPGEEYQIPPQGSLGLLAIGYKGLLAWRKTRKAHPEKKSGNTNGLQKSDDEGK